jgi:hypothetical protein
MRYLERCTTSNISQRFWGAIWGHDESARPAKPRKNAALRPYYESHRLRQSTVLAGIRTSKNPLFSSRQRVFCCLILSSDVPKW